MATVPHPSGASIPLPGRWTLDTSRPAYRWWVTAALMLGLTAVGLNVTAVNLAFPQIMTSLRADLDAAQWVQTGAMITSAVMMPSVGWLGSVFGNRRLYLLALSVFVCGSLLCGSSWSITSLIGFRIVQALGMGLVMPLTRVILLQIFPSDKRGLAMGISTLGFAFGPMVGPVVSGYLLEYASWRTVFYINVPVGILSLLLAYLTLPATERRARRPLDSIGLVSMAVFLVTFLLAVSQGRKLGWDTAWILFLFAVALGAGVTFLRTEWRSPHPFVDLRLYRRVPFAMAALVSFLNTIGFMATNFLVALFLQQHLGYTPLQAAWMLLPSAVLVGAMSVVAGRLSDLLPPKLLVIGGLALVAGCLFQFATITAWTSVGLFTFWLTIRGVARAFIMAPLSAAAMASLPESEVRMGAGLLSVSRGLASASSVALVATWFQGRLDTHAKLLAQAQSIAAFGRDELVQSLTLTFTQMGDVGDMASRKAMAMLYNVIKMESALQAYHETFVIIGGLAVAAILPTLWMGQNKRPNAIAETSRSANA